jgi:hypothetical protein
MALITSQTETMPDLNYEYHTVTIDTIGQASANTFTCHLQQPLKNVVQARLLAARIDTTTDTKHCYVSIEELRTNFSDRASNVLTGQASLSIVRGSFASLVSDGDATITYKDNYPVVSQYITPIRRIDRFTVTIRDQTGGTITPGSGDSFMILRFVCRKPNL